MGATVANLFRLLFGRRSLPLNALREVVDGRKLDERREHEGEAEEEEEVESCRVRHLGNSLATGDSDRTSSEQCGDSYAIKNGSALIFVKKKNSSTHSVIVCSSSHSHRVTMNTLKR